MTTNSFFLISRNYFCSNFYVIFLSLQKVLENQPINAVLIPFSKSIFIVLRKLKAESSFGYKWWNSSCQLFTILHDSFKTNSFSFVFNFDSRNKLSFRIWKFSKIFFKGVSQGSNCFGSTGVSSIRPRNIKSFKMPVSHFD